MEEFKLTREVITTKEMPLSIGACLVFASLFLIVAAVGVVGGSIGLVMSLTKAQQELHLRKAINVGVRELRIDSAGTLCIEGQSVNCMHYLDYPTGNVKFRDVIIGNGTANTLVQFNNK